jgi:hypothetical protein
LFGLSGEIVRTLVLLSDHDRTLMTFGVGLLVPMRHRTFAVLAGLDPAIHATPPADGRKSMRSNAFEFTAPLAPLSAPDHVGGRVKPGHDAPDTSRAATTRGISRRQRPSL